MSGFAGIFRPGDMAGQSGVLLKRLTDESAMADAGFSDQNAAFAVRATRGRIDRANVVTRGSLERRLGRVQPMRLSALNEGLEHVYESLNNGVYQAVVARLHGNGAAIKWAVVYSGNGAVLQASIDGGGAVVSVTVTSGGSGYMPDSTLPVLFGAGAAAATAHVNADGEIGSVTVTAPGAGYATAPTATLTSQWQFGVQADEPEAGFFLAVKHLECFNDGFVIELHADEQRDGLTAMPTDVLSLRMTDANGQELYSFTGSLNPDARDDFGESYWLPAVASNATDNVVLLVDTPDAVEPGNLAYGYDSASRPRWVSSPVLVAFTEGPLVYSMDDYVRARGQLEASRDGFAYIGSGGTQSIALLVQMAALSYRVNRLFYYDVPGAMTAEAAMTWDAPLNMSGQVESHLISATWAPATSDAPSGVNNGRHIGVSGLRIGYSCARNAQTDNNGFAKKQFPISKAAWPINRTRIRPTYEIQPEDYPRLAQNKINVVQFENFTAGQLFVFGEVLTKAPVTNSLRKLIPAADMSADIDRRIAAIANDHLHLPMTDAIAGVRREASTVLEDADTAGWLVPSSVLGGASHQLIVRPKASNPYDVMEVLYKLSLEGCARVIELSQTFVRR